MVGRRPSPSPKKNIKKVYVLDDRANQPKKEEPALRSPHQCKGGISIVLFIRIVVIIPVPLSVTLSRQKKKAVQSPECIPSPAHPMALPLTQWPSQSPLPLPTPQTTSPSPASPAATQPPHPTPSSSAHAAHTPSAHNHANASPLHPPSGARQTQNSRSSSSSPAHGAPTAPLTTSSGAAAPDPPAGGTASRPGRTHPSTLGWRWARALGWGFAGGSCRRTFCGWCCRPSWAGSRSRSSCRRWSSGGGAGRGGCCRR